MEKLKHTDLRLLTYLYQHNRESLAKIAKETGLSREQVEYRLKQYGESGLIRGYIPIISYSRLGYHSQVLFFVKTKSDLSTKELKSALKNSKNRITTVEMLGKYDLGFVFIFKDDKEKNEFIIDFTEKNKENILDYHLIEPYHMKLYPLKFLGSKKENNYLWIDYVKKEVPIDEKEKKILCLLNKNSRMRIIDIAKKTGLSAELIVYKIRKLQNEGILLGSRTIFDMQRLGYFYTILQINLKNFSQKPSNKLEEFAKNSPNIDTFYLSIDKPNCYMQLFHKDVTELHQTIRSLKSYFKDEPISIEILPLENEGEDINVLPFL